MQCIGPSYVEFLKTVPAAIHSDACTFKNKDAITGLPAGGSRCVPTTAALSPPPGDV